MSTKYLNHDLLSRLGNLPLEARQSMAGNVSGRHRSANRGSSVEFAEYRKYVAGDDTRRLDWRPTPARTGITSRSLRRTPTCAPTSSWTFPAP